MFWQFSDPTNLKTQKSCSKSVKDAGNFWHQLFSISGPRTGIESELNRAQTSDSESVRTTDNVFTALHEMQTRSSDENSVCPSVCLSVYQTRDSRQNDVSRLCIPFERSFSLVFWEEEWLVGGPFYVKFWVNASPLERNRQFWADIRS